MMFAKEVGPGVVLVDSWKILTDGLSLETRVQEQVLHVSLLVSPANPTQESMFTSCTSGSPHLFFLRLCALTAADLLVLRRHSLSCDGLSSTPGPE